MNKPLLSVMSTLAIQGPLQDRIGPAFEAEAGVRLAMTYDPTTVLREAIAAGRRADVIVAIDSAVDALVAEGILQPASCVRIARTFVGLAKRAGTPPLDISTPEAFLETLRAAPSIVFSQSGASGIFFAALIERLGIAEDMRRKAIIVPKGFTAERLVTGEAALAVQQISELMVVDGVDIVGPFPDPYGASTSFVAAVFADAPHGEAALRFIDYLSADLAAAAFAAAGLEPAAPTGGSRAAAGAA